MTWGSGDYQYRVVEGWGRDPTAANWASSRLLPPIRKIGFTSSTASPIPPLSSLIGKGAC